jgi:sarcosine oxidase subunit gamma
MTRNLDISERDGLGLANVLVRKGQGAALASRLQERFGIGLPSRPGRAVAGEMALMGTGPGIWLAISERGGNAFAASLREAIGDLASVVDQSDGLAVVRLSGPKVRDVMGKLVAIDLDSDVFKVGDVAVTPAGHIGATLWRLDDLPAGPSVFELAVHRSFAASFREHLAEAAGAA